MSNEQFIVNDINLDLKRLPDDCQTTNTLVVFGHGAGAPLDHAHMSTICESLAEQGIATLRFNFPFGQRRGGRDSEATTLAVISAAWQWSLTHIKANNRYLGGHSFGGRMATLAASKNNFDLCRGLICYSFPLHPPNKPSIKRCAHFSQLKLPSLLLNGSRDKLAQSDLIQQVDQLNKTVSLCRINGSDHSFKTLKRDPSKVANPYHFAAEQVQKWVSTVNQTG